MGYKIVEGNEPPKVSRLPMMFEGGLQRIFAQ